MRLSLARRCLVLAALLAVFLLGGTAEARHVRFAGPHPVHARHGGGYCYIELPHVHGYSPDHAALYSDGDDGYRFVGDPSPFGYEGDRHPFYGHHPIPLAHPGAPLAFCYIDGPHFHPFDAPDGDEYRRQKGVAFYIGPYAPVYFQERPHKVKVWQAEYRPFVALRPTVEVRPPPEWRGEVWVAPPAPGVMVEVPAPPPVVVAPPPPRGRVVVTAPAPHVVIAPPRPHIVVAPPRPHIVVAPPAPHVVVAPAPVVVVRGKHGHGHGHGGWKHDNGKHKGWYKH